MTAEQLRHLSPMDWEPISLTGDYTWGFNARSPRTQLSVQSYRPWLCHHVLSAQKAGFDVLTP
jgi:hypothetical protein